MEKIEQARNSMPSPAIMDDKSKEIKASKKLVGQKQNSPFVDVNVNSKPPLPKTEVSDVEDQKKCASKEVPG